MKTKTKAWISLALFIITIGVNFLGGTGQINNTSQSDVSDMYNTLITPAGFTFSIWSVIYGLLFVSLVVMIIKSDENYYRQAIEKITPYLWASFIFNIIWIITFSYVLVGISNLFIFAYLFSLTFILLQLKDISHQREWLLPLTFGLNTGWLFIASVVNVAAFLVKIEWGGWGIEDGTWAMIMLIVAAVLAGVVLMRVKNAAFPLPIAWAMFGIYQALLEKGADSIIGWTALAVLAVLLVLSVITFVRNDKAVYPVKNHPI